MDKSDSIFVAGHRGLVGSAIVRNLEANGYGNIITGSRQEVDLLDAAQVTSFFRSEKPSMVVDAAAKVGGIKANNDYPVDFLLQNMRIQNNLISTAYESGVRKFLLLGSSCIYPKLAEQPIREDSLLTGPLEATNEWYAIAKIAGIKLCQAYAKQYGANFISAMPTNLYGPRDNYDLQNSHVLPALIRKVHEAKLRGDSEVVVWGTGTPRREFLHSDDLAAACRVLLEQYDSPEVVNVGCGEDVTIRELAETVCEVLGYEGTLTFDTSKPDGTPRKLLDVSRMKSLGWAPKIPLSEGISGAYRWFLENVAE